MYYIYYKIELLEYDDEKQNCYQVSFYDNNDEEKGWLGVATFINDAKQLAQKHFEREILYYLEVTT
jgi:hypothetical protein